ncbi:hypothetical protein ACFE04_028365 [Oxalis oulophora]
MMILILSVVTLFVSGFNACPKCGSFEVPYPLSTSENCGNPKYKIYCINQTLHFKSSSVQGFFYEILSIDPYSNKLIILPPKILENTCYSFDIGFGGLQLDEDLPFNISTRNNVMLFNCSTNILLSPLNCSAKSFCRQFEAVVKEGSGCRNTVCCHFLKDTSMTSHRIRVRVGGCTAYTSVVNLNSGTPIQSWKYGIELQWAPPY